MATAYVVVLAGVLGASLTFASGCAGGEAPGPRAEEVARRVAEATHRADQSRANAMRPMLGRWVVDRDATLEENRTLPLDARDAIRKDLTEYPFELTITDRDYVSRSHALTIADRYVLLRADGPSVTILLSSADGVTRGGDREATLRVRDGKLLLNPGRGTFTAVLSRAAAGGE